MIHILSLGAGVQSSTLALMAAAGEVTPMPDCAIFADTQAESPSTYEWLDWLERQLPYPVHRVSYGDLSVESLRVTVSKRTNRKYMHKYIPAFIFDEGGKASLMARTCTSNFKIRPMQKLAKKLMADSGGSKCVTWMGISLDEIQRMKVSLDKWNEYRYPLIESRMSRHDCLRWMEKNGFPTPPRSACVFCPFKRNDEWRDMKDNDQPSWRAAVEFERKMQIAMLEQEAINGTAFLHKSGVLLPDVDLSTAEENGQYSMLDECEGMCGV